MFQKKQYIYSETLGVCQVENIVQLSTGKLEPVSYYVLRPVADKEKVSYIPVMNHQVALRELFSAEEAKELAAQPETAKNELLKSAVDFVLKLGGEDGTTRNP